MTTKTGADVLDLVEYRERKANISEISEGTGGDYDLSDRVEKLEISIQSLEERIGDKEKASARNLYSSILESDYMSPISKNIDMLQEGIEYLEQAKGSLSNEIEREGYIDLFFNCIRRLTVHSFSNDNFNEALTSLIVALESHVTIPYSAKEIDTLFLITNILKNNFAMNDDNLYKCIDLLEDADFDLSFPLRGIDFDEIT